MSLVRHTTPQRTTMSLTPMSRNSMQRMKMNTENTIRLSILDKIVKSIYTCAITFAKKSTDTTFRYPLIATYHEMREEHLSGYLNGIDPIFYRRNMLDILNNLQELFPDCFITHATLILGQDRNMYDTSKIDESIKPFLTLNDSREYITIDWS